jgi:hypothetical protein
MPKTTRTEKLRRGKSWNGAGLKNQLIRELERRQDAKDN